jgi:hypothetical protein
MIRRVVTPSPYRREGGTADGSRQDAILAVLHALIDFLQEIGSNFVEFFNVRRQTHEPSSPDTTDGDDAEPPSPQP